MDATDLSSTIETVAGRPQRVAVDGQEVQSHGLTEIIEADRYLAGKAALTGAAAQGGARSGWNSLRPARMIPPGAVARDTTEGAP